MKILCGEDVYVHKNLVFSIENIQKKVDEHQYFLLNLESPLIDKIEVKPSLKGGSNLSMKLNPLEPISKIYNKLILSGANNHIGEDGVLSTLRFFKENNISNLGCGKNREEVSKSLILEDLKSSFIKKRISIFSYIGRKFNYQNFLSFRNQLTCEFHRELLINLNLYNRKQTTLQI